VSLCVFLSFFFFSLGGCEVVRLVDRVLSLYKKLLVVLLDIPHLSWQCLREPPKWGTATKILGKFNAGSAH